MNHQAYAHDHGHSHGLVDRSIVRSRAGLRAVGIRERWAGPGVVLAIFAGACVAHVQTIPRFIHPQHFTHLWWLAAAGLIGFAGDEVAARIRTRAGKRPNR